MLNIFKYLDHPTLTCPNCDGESVMEIIVMGFLVKVGGNIEVRFLNIVDGNSVLEPVYRIESDDEIICTFCNHEFLYSDAEVSE